MPPFPAQRLKCCSHTSTLHHTISDAWDHVQNVEHTPPDLETLLDGTATAMWWQVVSATTLVCPTHNTAFTTFTASYNHAANTAHPLDPEDPDSSLADLLALAVPLFRQVSV